jgi:hypothetical protein
MNLSATYGRLKAQQGLGVGLGWRCGPAGTPSLPTQQLQVKPCRCFCRVASIIERIDLGYASNLMRVIICFTAPYSALDSALNKAGVHKFFHVTELKHK